MQENSSNPMTLRAFVWGMILAVFLAGINTYVTLKVGVMEEGATVAFLIFIVYVKTFRLANATKAEAVMVATMGSAGGSLSFLANLFASITMSGTALTWWEMAIFSTTTSLVGMSMAVPLRQLYIVNDPLKWPSARVVMSCIDSVVDVADSLQPRILAFFGTGAILYVIASAGLEWFPEAVVISALGLAKYKVGLACSPLLIGCGYLIGLRIGIGFLLGALALFVMGPYIPRDSVGGITPPNLYLWPGVAALVAAGITALVINWRMILRALKTFTPKSMMNTEEKDKVMSGRALLFFIITSFIFAVIVLHWVFEVAIPLAITSLVVSGLLLNVISTRAAGETSFNPVRVMGVMNQGLAWLMGTRSINQILVSAGIPAGAIGQSALFVQDAYFGRHYGVKARTQLLGQGLVLIPASISMALVYVMLEQSYGIGAPTAEHKAPLTAPVAAMWSLMGKIFSGDVQFPAFALEAMILGAGAGIVFAILDHVAKRGIIKDKYVLWRFTPHSLGITLGMVLPIYADTAFFAGALLLCVVVPKVFNLRRDDEDPFLLTIAAAGIVGEGIGGLGVGICKYFHLL